MVEKFDVNITTNYLDFYLINYTRQPILEKKLLKYNFITK